MESPAYSPSSSRRQSTWSVPLTGGGMDGYGVPRRTTMTRIRSGVSVRVSFKLKNSKTFTNEIL